MDKPKYKYPKNERVWTSYFNSAGCLMFIVTSKPSQDFYILYELVDNEFKKLGRSKSPLELEQKFDIRIKLNQE